MTLTEFRNNTKAAFDAVDRGEQVLITRGGDVYTLTKLTDTLVTNQFTGLSFKEHPNAKED